MKYCTLLLLLSYWHIIQLGNVYMRSVYSRLCMHYCYYLKKSFALSNIFIGFVKAFQVQISKFFFYIELMLSLQVLIKNIKKCLILYGVHTQPCMSSYPHAQQGFQCEVGILSNYCTQLLIGSGYSYGSHVHRKQNLD